MGKTDDTKPKDKIVETKSCSSPLIERTRSDKVKLINFRTSNYEYTETNLRRKSKDNGIIKTLIKEKNNW